MSRPRAEIAITARVCILYGDFSGRSDSRFSCFESPVVPREKRVLLSMQRLVGSASGPALIKPCRQLLGVRLRMWCPFRLDLAGLRPSTNCASVLATCLGDSGGSWRVPDKNRPPRWSVAAGVSRRQFRCASGARFRLATGRSYLIGAMANAGEVPKFFRWGHGKAFSESRVDFSRP